MLKACQLPEDILKESTTEELLEICMKYPLLNNYAMGNSMYEGMSNVVLGFNGLKEFMDRPDAPAVLLKLYKKQDINNISKMKNDVEKGGYVFEICALEMMFSQNAILNKTDDKMRREIFNAIKEKYVEKAKYSHVFGFLGEAVTAFTGYKYSSTISSKSVKEPNEDKKIFTERMLVKDENVVKDIIIRLIAK